MVMLSLEREEKRKGEVKIRASFTLPCYHVELSTTMVIKTELLKAEAFKELKKKGDRIVIPVFTVIGGSNLKRYRNVSIGFDINDSGLINKIIIQGAK